MTGVTASTALLGEKERLVLQAVTGSGQPAVDAFRRWRALVPLDDIGYAAFRVMPLLLALVKREGLDDPDILRMKGIERQAWAANTMRLKHLFLTMDALRRAGAPFVVLKGAALFARMPEFAALRASGDYDVLVDPSHIGAARRELEAVGFTMSAFSFDDLESELQGSATPGAAMTLPGSAGEIDIHWRALPNLRDLGFTRLILQSAEEHTLSGRPVPIPTLAHHLFTCLARCEPWDKDECLARVLEAYFLLRKFGDAVDWRELERLIARYRLEATASAFFEEIAALGISVPAQVRKPPRSFLSRKEWDIRGITPAGRTNWQWWFLNHIDTAHGRREPGDWSPTFYETFLASRNRGKQNLGALWRSASRRTSRKSDGRFKFLHGFSFPEKWGRWTDGHFAFLVVPLTSEQKNGAPVEVRGHILGTGNRTRIGWAGGLGTETVEMPPGQLDLTLSVRMRPLEQLGGDGLLVLWLPDAVAPLSLGINLDYRALSIGIHRTETQPH
jgi:hypothetical protein